jgi:hypothetical protein
LTRRIGGSVCARLLFFSLFFGFALFAIFLSVGLCAVWHNGINRNMRDMHRHTHDIDGGFRDASGEKS